MPDNPTTTQNPNDQGAGAAQTQQTQASVYDELATKKGFKDQDSFAKSYSELEKSYSSTNTKVDKIRQQLESVGYKVNDDGTIVSSDNGNHFQTNQPGAYPQYPQGQPGQGYPQGQGDVLYDPYTMAPLTDPVALQLAKMPLGQREAFITQSILNKRDELLNNAQDIEEEIMETPEFKGFEREVRKVMRKVPLHQRASKDVWKDALLRVKGAQFDAMRKQVADGAVSDFINKDNVQGFSGAMGGGGQGQSGGTKASQEELAIWNQYKNMKDNPFKDINEFLQYQRSNSPARG